MALRSRSHTATATSGPGRAPASDGRARHRRPSAAGTGSRSGGGRVRHEHRHRDRDTSAEELRRRAEALFGERGGGLRDIRGARVVPSWAVGGTGPDPVADPDPSASGERRPAGRTVLALRERLPLWVRTRCGLERRSVIALSVVLVVAVGFAVQHFWGGRTQPVRAPEVVGAAVLHEENRPAAPAGAGEPADTGTAGAAPEIVVDVGGKVRDPGVHRLPAGSRVADALRAAGGVRPGTRTDGLNRARFLVDGEQVIVGGPAPAAGPEPVAGGPAGPAAGAGPTAPVSLNTATSDQLETLPGVGPVLARHIIEYRTRNGGFRSVDELREVNGIGDRRFADLRNLVRP
ncbi:ComEA family DNA-binding protein [Streptomyces sp. M2CJ-2]|uniref:ComEA family DNA-binding protein n=1 Tax=Streptomyces sp. M2CJ-2 TaxID=2803948 RepID=UPI001927E6A2|nr:ComEA family DNA-binding protein [Streptomyces sp. M2CJ-2]MBL3666932.1 ComEA family DNA-binding protein [Streptomyces sp. M2CJ-2]